jgi:hypothetical protein
MGPIPIPDLYQNGTLKDMLRKRMITPSTMRNVELFLEVKNQELSGVKRTRAVAMVADKIPGKAKDTTKKRQVWRAINCFEGGRKR